MGSLNSFLGQVKKESKKIIKLVDDVEEFLLVIFGVKDGFVDALVNHKAVFAPQIAAVGDE
jgi:hypothetical protein